MRKLSLLLLCICLLLSTCLLVSCDGDEDEADGTDAFTVAFRALEDTPYISEEKTVLSTATSSGAYIMTDTTYCHFDGTNSYRKTQEEDETPDEEYWIKQDDGWLFYMDSDPIFATDQNKEDWFGFYEMISFFYDERKTTDFLDVKVEKKDGKEYYTCKDLKENIASGLVIGDEVTFELTVVMQDGLFLSSYMECHADDNVWTEERTYTYDVPAVTVPEGWSSDYEYTFDELFGNMFDGLLGN